MEHTGAVALETHNGQVDHLSSALPGVSKASSRDSEVRRCLFAAAHHGTLNEASLGSFPGKFAWIAVVLFALSMLIAFVG